MLAPSSSLGVGMPVGPRRFIDRTPRKAALRPLPKPFRLLSFRGTGGQPWIGNSVPSSESEDSSLRPEELACFRELVRHDTITCWTQAEVDHPIHFFEQFVQCHHCGAQRFRITTETKCCRNGALILNDVQRLPEDLLDLMTGTSALWSHGVSKESRVLNNSFRFGQQVLPRIGGEVQTHVSDAYQHLRITGIPYTVVPNLNASSALRSYVDDPEARSALVSSFSGVVRPTSVLVSEIRRKARARNRARAPEEKVWGRVRGVRVRGACGACQRQASGDAGDDGCRVTLYICMRAERVFTHGL